MQIIEHQNIQLSNLLSYNTKVKHSDILKLTKYISDNLHVLDLTKNDNIIFAEKEHENDEMVDVEILVPVKGKVEECSEYDYKPIFKLSNAVIIRHEGSLKDLPITESLLNDFIKEHDFQPSAGPYYIVVRNGSNDSDDCIIDICIGIG